MITLVTGAAGHVGANLVRVLLTHGHTVRALVHHNKQALEGLGVETVYGDVRDPSSLVSAFKNVDTVYHLAASLALTPDRWRDMEPVNVNGTRNIIDACLQNHVHRLVHFSSVHAMDPDSGRKAIDETCNLMKNSDWPPYGFSKAAGEKEIEKGIQQGLDAVIIRPTSILGPYDFQPSFFGEVLILLAKGKLPGMVDGGFDWVDVRDVVEGAIRAAQTAPSGSDYLLSGHWASLREIAGITEKITGKSAPRFNCPLWLAAVGAPLVTCYDRLRHRRPLYTSFSIKTLKDSPCVSHEKATRELAYQPRPLAQSVADTLEWFRQTGKIDYSPRVYSGVPS
jgi:dihydroflavonol-4-reductase